MANPQTQTQQNMDQGPRTVIGAKVVELALITYFDESGRQQTQLAVVGDHHVHLIESRTLGVSNNTTPQGVASNWLVEGVFEKLGRSRKKTKKE